MYRTTSITSRDILRLQTDTKGELTGYAYADWLKKALSKNQPWDGMVRELLTTDGSSWNSGAVGFYMRDQGMPLDHLAATVQVFLGTQIVCAQCHNHPFDKWSADGLLPHGGLHVWHGQQEGL